MYYPYTWNISSEDKLGMQILLSKFPPRTQSHALEMEGSNYNEYIVAINFTLIFKIYGLC